MTGPLAPRPPTLDGVTLAVGPGLDTVGRALLRRHFLAGVTADLDAGDVAVTTDVAIADALERRGVPCVVVVVDGDPAALTLAAAALGSPDLVVAAVGDVRAIEHGLCADPAYGVGGGLTLGSVC